MNSPGGVHLEFMNPPREDCHLRAESQSDNPFEGDSFLLYTPQGCHICDMYKLNLNLNHSDGAFSL